MKLLAKLIAWILLPFYRLKLRFTKALPAPPARVVRIAFSDATGHREVTVTWSDGDVRTYRYVGVEWCATDGSGEQVVYNSKLHNLIEDVRRFHFAGLGHPLLERSRATEAEDDLG